MGLSKNFAHWRLSEECSYTFSIFVKLGESIFSALVESHRVFFFVEFVDTNYWRHGYCLGLVVVRVDGKWSCHGGRVTKRQIFFVSDEADRHFVSSPWSGAYRGRYFETGFWRLGN